MNFFFIEKGLEMIKPKDLNGLIHTKVRLGIMSLLMFLHTIIQCHVDFIYQLVGIFTTYVIFIYIFRFYPLLFEQGAFYVMHANASLIP